MRFNRDRQNAPAGVNLRIGRLVCAALLVVVGAYALEALLGTQGSIDRLFNNWIYNGLLVAAGACCLARAMLVRVERLPWLLLSAALLLWTTGDLYYYFFLSGLENVPIPSVADLFYLAFYPVSYVALALLLRGRMRRFQGNLWLDGVIAALAVGALGAAVVFDKVLSTTGGSALVVATNLAYPLADLLLLSLVVAMFALTGWRFDRTWAFVAAGYGVFAIADTAYLYQTAEGRYVEGGILDAGWPAALVLIACAAWQPVTRLRDVRSESWKTLTLPTFFALVSLTLLVYDHFVRVNVVAIVLASAAIGMVIVRAVLTFRERVRLLEYTREESLTDALTGLGNRRRFVSDLEELLTDGSAALVLIVFDLDGFKAYNDAFGHSAGDAMLARVARRLALTPEEHGRAYRLGGDEFCVLATTDDAGPGALIERSTAALTAEGEGFSVTCSYGAVLIPSEAEDLTEALRIADDRMYADKQRNHPGTDRQSIDVLISVLEERDSALAHHLADVADLAEAVGRRLHVPEPQLAAIRQAAELHDVGKLAIPEEILGKPGPLAEDEWAFVRRHTVIGERILGSAPVLAEAATIVRSTHERWDGMGYPDRLAGVDIPLGARIISVCDAFDAMTSNRPYATALTREEAMRELFRCAGTQFDAEVVEAFAAVQADLTKLVA
ncbi:MAG TPA: diguanylate cyclase [Gaiellaceae bacterium]|nr:diguanylate cyclase [Gaiellaceae bacterium]